MDNEKPISLEDKLKVNGVVCHAFSPDRNLIAISLKREHCIGIFKITNLNDINSW